MSKKNISQEFELLKNIDETKSYFFEEKKQNN